jgi:hypothetical protein
MKMWHGTNRALEDEADRLIKESLKGITSRAAKSDILTPWKLEDRTTREILTSTGYADPAVRKGMFKRAWNPRHAHLNSRDGAYPPRRYPTLMDAAPGDGEYYDGDGSID